MAYCACPRSRCDRDFTSREVNGGRAFVEFDTAGPPQVVARIGISFVSADNARANAESEQGGRGFEEIRDGTRAAWNDMLGRR